MRGREGSEQGGRGLTPVAASICEGGVHLDPESERISEHRGVQRRLSKPPVDRGIFPHSISPSARWLTIMYIFFSPSFREKKRTSHHIPYSPPIPTRETVENAADKRPRSGASSLVHILQNTCPLPLLPLHSTHIQSPPSYDSQTSPHHLPVPLPSSPLLPLPARRLLRHVQSSGHTPDYLQRPEHRFPPLLRMGHGVGSPVRRRLCCSLPRRSSCCSCSWLRGSRDSRSRGSKVPDDGYGACFDLALRGRSLSLS